MAQGNEGKYISKVHRQLSSEIYRMKMNMGIGAPGGVPDYYYEGSKAILWVEYKYVTAEWASKRTFPFNQISPLQLHWARRALENNQNHLFIFGDPNGEAKICTWDDMHNKKSVLNTQTYSTKEVAKLIHRLIMEE